MSKPTEEKSVPVTGRQAEYLKGIIAARAALERDLQTAAVVILAGGNVDLAQGMGYEFRESPARLVYTLPVVSQE